MPLQKNVQRKKVSPLMISRRCAALLIFLGCPLVMFPGVIVIYYIKCISQFSTTQSQDLFRHLCRLCSAIIIDPQHRSRLHAIDFVGQVTDVDSAMAKRAGVLGFTEGRIDYNFVHQPYQSKLAQKS